MLRVKYVRSGGHDPFYLTGTLTAGISVAGAIVYFADATTASGGKTVNTVEVMGQPIFGLQVRIAFGVAPTSGAVTMFSTVEV